MSCVKYIETIFYMQEKFEDSKIYFLLDECGLLLHSLYYYQDKLNTDKLFLFFLQKSFLLSIQHFVVMHQCYYVAHQHP